MNNLINKSFRTIKNQERGMFFKKVENKMGYSYKVFNNRLGIANLGEDIRII